MMMIIIEMAKFVDALKDKCSGDELEALFTELFDFYLDNKQEKTYNVFADVLKDYLLS